MAFIKAEKLKHKFVRRDEQGEIEDVTLALPARYRLADLSLHR